MELDKFFTGQKCDCGGKIWSDNYGYSCKKCGKNHIINPTTNLKIKEFNLSEEKDE